MKRIFIITIMWLLLPHQSFGASPKQTIVIYIRDSLHKSISKYLTHKFAHQPDIRLKYVILDGSMLSSRLRIEQEKTRADIVIGLDMLEMQKAQDLGIWHPHSVDLNTITEGWDNQYFVPFYVGYLSIVYNQQKIQKDLSSLEDILTLPDHIKIVIPDPRTSMVGFGFLVWVKALYGDQSNAYWEKLKNRILTMPKGWSGAYSLFREGTADITISYTSSPLYHRCVEGNNMIKAMISKQGHLFQGMIMGKTINCKNHQIVDEIINHLLSFEIQNAIVKEHWMYPALRNFNHKTLTEIEKPQNVFFIFPKSSELKKMIHEWLSGYLS